MKKSINNKAVIAPLPVLIVCTYDENGIPDAMNAAWGGQCGYTNIALNLSSTHKTTRNIRSRGAFTVSLGTVDTMKLSDYFGIVSGNKNPDKVADSGVTMVKSENVDAPIIEDYPLTMECRVIAINEELGETRVVGEIINTIVDDSIVDEKGAVDYNKLQPISFDSETNSYRIIGEKVGKAFYDGKDYPKK